MSDRGLPGAREESLQRAIEILEALRAEYPRVPDYRALLGRAYRELPPWSRDSTAASTANPLDRAVEILTELVAEFPDVPDYRYDLCEAYAAVGPPDPRWRRLDRGDSESEALGEVEARASDWLSEALRISESLVAEHPNVPDYVTSQVRIRHKLSRLLADRQQLDEAVEMASRAMALQRGLVARFPNVSSYQLWLAVIEESIARCRLQQGQPKEAIAILETMARRLEKSTDDSSRTAFLFQLFRVRAYLLLSETERRRGDVSAANAWDERARELKPRFPAPGSGPPERRGEGGLEGRASRERAPGRRMWMSPPPAGFPPFTDLGAPRPGEPREGDPPPPED